MGQHKHVLGLGQRCRGCRCCSLCVGGNSTAEQIYWMRSQPTTFQVLGCLPSHGLGNNKSYLLQPNHICYYLQICKFLERLLYNFWCSQTPAPQRWWNGSLHAASHGPWLPLGSSSLATVISEWRMFASPTPNRLTSVRRSNVFLQSPVGDHTKNSLSTIVVTLCICLYYSCIFTFLKF